MYDGQAVETVTRINRRAFQVEEPWCAKVLWWDESGQIEGPE